MAKQKKQVVLQFENGVFMMTHEGMEGFEIPGMHLGPHTKVTHPYSYDPLLIYRTDEAPTDGCYSDRLATWYGHERVRALEEKHLNGKGYSRASPSSIEAFLREILDAPELKLARIEEQCNQATGYPLWYFGYLAKPKTS